MSTTVARRAAALAIATAAAAGIAAPAATAATVPNLPAPTPMPLPVNPDGGTDVTRIWADEPVGNTVTPYHDGTPLRCVSGADHSRQCWQRRPDGQWQSLLETPFGVQVYPVWEDPAALADSAPALRRDAVRNATPEPLRSLVPQQVWNLIPR